MNSLSIVVLGGTGFVGRHLAATLSAAGHRLTVLSRSAAQHLEADVLPNTRVRTCDVYSSDALVEHFRDADAVVNLVGILNERGRSGAGFRRAHVELTATVIDACRQAGVNRLLQMSALNAGRGRSHYLRTRGEAEALVKASGLDWTIFEPSVIFGPGDGLFERFAGLLKIVPLLPLARARSKFAPVYVGDVCAAMLRCLQRPDSSGQTYELYGPRVMTLQQIVRYTAQTLGLHRAIVPLPDGLGRLQALLCDFVPGKPFSTDNFLSLLTDSVGGIDGLHRLGITPTPIESVVPRMLRGSDRQRRLDLYRAHAARLTRDVR